MITIPETVFEADEMKYIQYNNNTNMAQRNETEVNFVYKEKC